MSSLVDLLARVPDGWSVAAYGGRRYGVTRTARADGRAISVYAEELGGTDVVSTNVYVTTGGEELRPCEMPAEKVLAFLREATFEAEQASPATPGPPETTGRFSEGCRGSS